MWKRHQIKNQLSLTLFSICKRFKAHVVILKCMINLHGNHVKHFTTTSSSSNYNSLSFLHFKSMQWYNYYASYHGCDYIYTFLVNNPKSLPQYKMNRNV